MINDFEKANPDIGVREPFKDGTTMVSEIHAAQSLHPPGNESLALAVAEQADKQHAVLLTNHGPVVAGADLSDAVYAIEELEETAKLSPCCKANKAGRSAAMRRRNWKLASRGVCYIRRASPRL